MGFLNQTDLGSNLSSNELCDLDQVVETVYYFISLAIKWRSNIFSQDCSGN